MSSPQRRSEPDLIPRHGVRLQDRAGNLGPEAAFPAGTAEPPLGMLPIAMRSASDALRFGGNAAGENGVERLFRYGSTAVYVVATTGLMLLSLFFVISALYEVVQAALAGEPVIRPMLDAVGLIIIALAVYDVAKFLFEEEILRPKEMREAREARRTLTKFLTIIIIATALEALVQVFETGKENVEHLLYPTLLMAVVVLLIAGLAFYQRVSRSAETIIPPGEDEDG